MPHHLTYLKPTNFCHIFQIGSRHAWTERKLCRLNLIFFKLGTTLPTGSDGDFRFNVISIVKWPVVNDFRVVSLIHPFLSINVQFYFRIAYTDGEMVPLIITNLQKDKKGAFNLRKTGSKQQSQEKCKWHTRIPAFRIK